MKNFIRGFWISLLVITMLVNMETARAEAESTGGTITLDMTISDTDLQKYVSQGGNKEGVYLFLKHNGQVYQMPVTKANNWHELFTGMEYGDYEFVLPSNIEDGMIFAKTDIDNFTISDETPSVEVKAKMSVYDSATYNNTEDTATVTQQPQTTPEADRKKEETKKKGKTIGYGTFFCVVGFSAGLFLFGKKLIQERRG